MTAAELQARLAQPYDRARWLDTLGKTLSRTEIFAAPQPVPADTTRAESIVQLGKVHLAGQRNLALLEVTVGDRVDLLRNRVGLRQLVARYIDQAEYHGVLAIFHQRDAKDYRFTFAAREAALDAGGQQRRPPLRQRSQRVPRPVEPGRGKPRPRYRRHQSARPH